MQTEEPPQLHGLVYDIKEGILKDLNVDIALLKKYEHIYSMLGESPKNSRQENK